MCLVFDSLTDLFFTMIFTLYKAQDPLSVEVYSVRGPIPSKGIMSPRCNVGVATEKQGESNPKHETSEKPPVLVIMV